MSICYFLFSSQLSTPLPNLISSLGGWLHFLCHSPRSCHWYKLSQRPKSLHTFHHPSPIFLASSCRFYQVSHAQHRSCPRCSFSFQLVWCLRSQSPERDQAVKGRLITWSPSSSPRTKQNKISCLFRSLDTPAKSDHHIWETSQYCLEAREEYFQPGFVMMIPRSNFLQGLSFGTSETSAVAQTPRESTVRSASG